jgi:hypothetical protein
MDITPAWNDKDAYFKERDEQQAAKRLKQEAIKRQKQDEWDKFMKSHPIEPDPDFGYKRPRKKLIWQVRAEQKLKRQ